ncbi:transcriptional regulator [Shinella sp. S4-D37]|uniref:transcriptional regulator n=1 Tax=Shinella sp. S4-D37 TaxID=3161999 RepID=UPI0034654C92
MKKPPKNFVVEYKGARRKPTPQSNSIWGNVDLRRFAEHDGEAETPGAGALRIDSDAAMHEVSRASTLTADLQQKTTSSLPPEEQMADDTSMTEQMSTEPETALVKAPEPKKRGPRAKKVLETVTSDALVDAPAVKKTRAKRGSKNAATEVKPVGRRGGRKAKAAVGSIVEPAMQAVSPIAAAGEEMEDLLQLEQENQRLRKLLAEKLREENASLRKRLGLD